MVEQGQTLNMKELVRLFQEVIIKNHKHSRWMLRRAVALFRGLVAFDCADRDVVLAGRDCWCWAGTELGE